MKQEIPQDSWSPRTILDTFFFRQKVLSLLSEDIDFELCMIYRLA